MSILKGSNSGIHAKLTPTYIPSFGYTQDEKERDVFRKKDKFVVWKESERKFVYPFEHFEPISEFSRPRDRFSKKYEYYFDSYEQLKILEQYWFSKSKSERKNAFEKILKEAKEVFSFVGAATSIFSKMIGQDLVPVQPMSAPEAKLSYFDFPIKKK